MYYPMLHRRPDTKLSIEDSKNKMALCFETEAEAQKYLKDYKIKGSVIFHQKTTQKG